VHNVWQNTAVLLAAYQQINFLLRQAVLSEPYNLYQMIERRCFSCYAKIASK
jgi:hypothetical protein